MLADVEDRELRADVEGDAGVLAESVRRLDGGRHPACQGRSLRIPTGVTHARVYHSTIM